MEANPIPNISPTERFARITREGEQPLHSKGREEKYELVRETFDFFGSFLTAHGYTAHTNADEAYRQLPNKKIIARREDPRKLFEVFNNPAGYTINFVGDRYANCVTWNPHADGSKNLYNAFMEGFTNLNGVVAVIGFLPDTTNDLMTMPDSIQNFHGLDRSGVRSYQGTITKEQLYFVTLRVPGHLLPESCLTEDELDLVDAYQEEHERTGNGTPVMVFRTYLPSKIKYDA